MGTAQRHSHSHAHTWFSKVGNEPLQAMYDQYSFNVIPAIGQLVRACMIGCAFVHACVRACVRACACSFPHNKLHSQVAGDRNSYQYLVESIRTFPNQEDLRARTAGWWAAPDTY